MLSVVAGVWAWVRGGSLMASVAPHVVLCLAMFGAGWLYGAARADRSAEIAALRSEIAAHELANGLREQSEREEADAAKVAAEIEAHNAKLFETRPEDAKAITSVFDGAFLSRLRDVR